MKRSARTLLILVLVLLLPAMVMLQAAIDPQRKQFLPEREVVSSVVADVGNNPVVLPSQFVAGAIIGFREVIAGLLWVRANDFFHTGNYEAVVPLTRIITWLDPHQIDVYSVGAWHLAYNFVDSQSRADRRYLIPAIKFLEEGVQNNPHLWDLYFEQGFTMYLWKKQDYARSVYWLKEAAKRDPPFYVHTQIAHALERNGQVDAAVEQWRKCIRMTDAVLKKQPNNRTARIMGDVSRKNLALTIWRQMDRAEKAKNPREVNFDATFSKVGPRMFRISGKANLPDGTRINVLLVDADYKEPELTKFTWDIDPDLTMVNDTGINGIMLENGRFDRIYDLSRDLKQYPLAAKTYKLNVWFEPRGATQDVKDHSGWSGECITDRRYLDTSVKGVRMVRKVIVLKREDII